MKKIVIIVLVLLMAAGGYFLFFSNEKVEDIKEVQTSSNTTSSTEQAEIKTITEAPLDVERPILDEKESDLLDKKIEETENKWLSQVENLLVKDLGISEEKFREYLKIREGHDNDKIRAFENFHKQMEAKHGENYSYNPTEEELLFEKEIKKKYDKVLMKHFGEENFKVYLELRDKFNQNLIENQDPEQGVILMDL